jgi:hypothetical protein
MVYALFAFEVYYSKRTTLVGRFFLFVPVSSAHSSLPVRGKQPPPGNWAYSLFPLCLFFVVVLFSCFIDPTLFVVFFPIDRLFCSGFQHAARSQSGKNGPWKLTVFSFR